MYLIILFLSSKYSSNLTERCSLSIIFNPSYAFPQNIRKYEYLCVFTLNPYSVRFVSNSPAPGAAGIA